MAWKFRFTGGLLLLILLMGCAPRQETGVVGECLRRAVHFTFDDTAESVPPCLVDLLRSKKMVLVGEIHYVKEHGFFVSRLLERLHDSGFRYFLQEVGTAEGAVINAYIHGEDVMVREDHYAYDEEMISHLAKFNEQLRAQGRHSEQFQYAGFDLNHQNTYHESMQILCGLYGTEPLSGSAELCGPNAFDNPELSAEQREQLQHITDSEVHSRAIRADWSNADRERFMEEQLLYTLQQAGEGEKILVNTGIFHAQLCPEWTIDENSDFEWLAMRMKQHLPEDEVYTIGVNVMEGRLLKSWHGTEVLEYAACYGEEYEDLIARLRRMYPGETVFIDFQKLELPPENIHIQNPLRNTDIPVRSLFDGMLIYPEATPVHNPTLP